MTGTLVPKTGSDQPRRRGVTRRTYPWKHLTAKALTVILVFSALGGIWQGVIRWLNVPSYTAPAPSTIFLGLEHNWTVVWTNAETTALEAAAGFGIGTGVACVLALIFVYLPYLRTGLMPVAIALSTVPIVAIAPILVLLLGQGMLSKVVMTSMICFFPTLMNLGRGLDAVDAELLDLFRVYDASRWQLLVKARLASARPYFFSALRVTSTAAVIGAIVAEWVNADRGLGFMIIQTTFNFDAVLLWGALIVAIALAVIFFLIVVIVDNLSGRYVVQ